MSFVDGNEHQQAGRSANQRMGPKSRRPAVIGAFVSDHRAGDKGRQQARCHLDIVSGQWI
jgi:hypothetical protein